MRAAMARPKKKAPSSELSRDMYGFLVRPQHLQQYQEFASIYKEEEAERSERWDDFLKTYNNTSEPATKTGDLNTKPESVEEVKPRTIQRWSGLRSSLSIIEQGLVTGVEQNGVNLTGKTLARQDNGEAGNVTSEDDDEDQFYDVDKGDGNDSSDHSDNEASTAPHGEDCPWREEVQSLVRGGVPMALRGELWQVFVRTKARRIEGHYDHLLEEPSSNGNGVANGHPPIPALDKYANQIEKDLPRTFPGHPALDEDGRNALRRLLTAYARHNPDVGYCQAMNFFAALLLLLMPEENAFWTLTGIMSDYFEGYYSEKLLEAQVDQLVFEELSREQFPRLVSHLESLGVQIPWISGPWFLSIFVNVLPWECVLRVWDVLLFEGNRSMLFRTALALLDLHAPALLAAHDAGDFISVIQTMAAATFDSSQLVFTACMGFQKIDEKKLKSLRDKHRPVVLATLDERASELRLWRNSHGALAKKLSRKFTKSEGEPLRDGLMMTVSSGVDSEILEEDNDIIDEVDDEEIEEQDLREQVDWLKNQLCHALEQQKRATARAEELDMALMELVKEDNRRELSAKVESLESEVATLRQMLSDKQEQEKAMVQVMLRVEQEQKVTEDARRFAEQDAAAQRQAANLMQEKYEQAMDQLAAMEKRVVMAETMLEATMQYQAGQPGNARQQTKEQEPQPSKWSWSLTSPKVNEPPKPSSPADSVKSADSQEEPVRKQGFFSRINWRDRNKANNNSPAESRDQTKVDDNSSSVESTAQTLEVMEETQNPSSVAEEMARIEKIEKV